MPLRDHFRPPLNKKRSWEGVHGSWPTWIVQRLNEFLPDDYVAEPRVHVGSVEVDIATFEPINGHSATTPQVARPYSPLGYQPGKPTMLVETELPIPSEYEVKIFHLGDERRLVAAVAIISPSNKDREENRKKFVQKCEGMLRNNVCVAMVDIVTARSAKLNQELLERFGTVASESGSGPLYAISCRAIHHEAKWRLEAWEHTLEIGKPLPTLPLWLNEEFAVPLDLEVSYEATCKALRIE